MNTKTLSERALSIIEQYKNFTVGTATCSVPYFNNKTVRARVALRASIGKGSPKEICDEVKDILFHKKIDQNNLSGPDLKAIMTDNNIGIDCSGFAYHVLSAERLSNNLGTLDKKLHFVKCHGLIGKIRCTLRPIENCDVATLVDNKNSRVIDISQVQPGDIITMNQSREGEDRDHILIIHSVEYENFIPLKLYYSHTISYPEDGPYGTGVRQGYIEITNLGKNISQQIWVEEGRIGEANRLYLRAQKSTTALRRLFE